MDKTILIIIAAVIIVLIVVGLLLMQRRRTERLQADFGPEYDHAVRQTGDKRKAESELQNRQKRVEKLELRPLESSQRQKFRSDWDKVQAEFVDDPEQSINDADGLLQDLMAARGYPVKNFQQVADDISVDHPTVVQRFRTAHDIVVRHQRGQGGTEDLRNAMINYRALFDELLTEGGDESHQSKPRRKNDDPRTTQRV